MISNRRCSKLFSKELASFDDKVAERSADADKDVESSGQLTFSENPTSEFKILSSRVLTFSENPFARMFMCTFSAQRAESATPML